MTDEIRSRSGRQLYALLPAIYRTRDGAEVEDRRDLARYLDAFGVLLDGLRALLDQWLADAFPDDAPSLASGSEARVAQDWVLPYLGALVDARPVSIDPRGQRAEVASAVRWRQRKGTSKVAEALTEEVGLVSAVMQEGWQRVATTARLDGRHNRTVTVDTRRVMAAESLSVDQPGADFTRFEGVELRWRVTDFRRFEGVEHPQRMADFERPSALPRLDLGPSGVPVDPHGYQDVSLRTADTRAPSSDRLRGLYNPRRLLAWVAPEVTLFPLPSRRLTWAQFVRYEQELRLRTGESMPGESKQSGPQRFVCSYRGDVEISDDVVVLDGDQPYALEGLRFSGTVVASTTLVARQCSFQAIEARGASLDPPVLEAHDCSFCSIVASAGKVVLDACTVRGPVVCRALEAEGCILTGLVAGTSDGSVPVEIERVEGSWRSATQGDVRFLVEDSRHPAAAVLHPDNPSAVLRGSSGRELGRYQRGRRFPLVVGEELPVDLTPTRTGALAEPYELRDLVFHGKVRLSAGAIGLRRVAARELGLAAYDVELRAGGCLFETLACTDAPASSAPRTLVELEYCTVMALVGRMRLRMSDCIVVSATDLPDADACLRWSSVPPSWAPVPGLERCVHDSPCFVVECFGERLHGLLSPKSAASIRSGAEDGGELGAYHDAYWLQRLAGVEEKLLEHVPIGITPVLVPDPTLVRMPPRDFATATNDERE